MPKRIIDAVSAVLIYEDEIFMIKRQTYLKAFPGYHAFPGGKVDKADEGLGRSIIDPKVGHVSTAFLNALNRELIEELNFDLASAIDCDQVNFITHLGNALTPDFNPYRYDTHFFLIDVKEKPIFNVDENEAVDSFWKTAKKYSDDYDNGDILVVPPIINLIKILEKDRSNSQNKSFDFSYDAAKEVPCIESIKGVKQFMPLSNTLPPANRTNAFLIGNVLIDPAPKDYQEMQKLLYSLRHSKVDKILLTHHHCDHHENAPEIARILNCPILLSQYTLDTIKQKRGDNYFTGPNTVLAKEGDILTRWNEEDVILYAVPGHDEGQLAPAPISQKWFIAGDLFQGVGTVVVGGPEGDMIKYFKSLKKVIKLGPKVIFPSHGIGLGSTYRLKKTLEHREHREKQVLQLHEKGKSVEEITKLIYLGVDERLIPYAMVNVESHLDKLKREHKI